MSDDVTVTIGLPLPMDIVATLINLVGAAYPSASIDMTAGADRWGREVMSLQIPGAERYASVPDRERILAAKRVVEDERETVIAQLRAGVSVLTPEALQTHLGFLASRFFIDNPEAVNYLEVEMDVTDHDTQERFVLTVRRANGKTPHQFRIEAEAENERLRARIAELEGKV